VIARLNVGGPAIHASLLTERLDPARYHSLLVAGAEGPNEASYLDLHRRHIEQLVRLSSFGPEIHVMKDLASFRALVKVIREFRPHIVHTHTAKAGTIGRLAAWFCQVPIIVHTFHGHVLRGYFPPVQTWLFRQIECHLARSTTVLVAVSPTVRDELLAMGVGREDRFQVVPLGLDLSRFTKFVETPHVSRAALGLSHDAFVITIVARLVPIKAHEIFLRAALVFSREHPNPIFLVVGDGERLAELTKLAQALGLGARVRFLGWRADLERIYCASDVVTLTSRNEGSPVALIEAMAAGRPVVSTRVSDLVRHGDTGLLADIDDATGLATEFVRLARDPGLAARLGASAREYVLARYDASRLVTDVDDLYSNLLKRACLSG
jgi:glycosyltransferase involved in cell wall biosynthesis